MNSSSNYKTDPDILLERIRQSEERNKRGRLKIFFGMCAGVGKTFAMLQSALEEKEKGTDVIIGYVEPHDRPETQKLMEGLESLAPILTPFNHSYLAEPHIDQIIARKPQIVLIDELAHTNATGSRHKKRYQDILELLDNHIDVYTTLNIQHLESKADTVTQITGIIIRETLPDSIFEQADEVELIDLAPSELFSRLEEGKIYTADKSSNAANNFFRKGNITALREMALRLMADRVDRQVVEYMQENSIKGPWKSGLRLLVVIGASPHAPKLLRWSKSLAYTMGAKLLALHIELPGTISQSDQQQLSQNLSIARKLGIQLKTVSGTNLVESILHTAIQEKVTHIVIGKSRNRWFIPSIFRNNVVNKLLCNSHDIDVYVLGGDPGRKKRSFRQNINFKLTNPDFSYLKATLLILLTASACYLINPFLGYQAVAYIQLFTITIMALFFEAGPIILSTILSALIWDYFFIPPKFTLYIGKAEDILMLGLYVSIATLGGILTVRLRRQRAITMEREERTNALYTLTHDLSNANKIDDIIKIASSHLNRYFNLPNEIILFQQNKPLLQYNSLLTTPYDISVAEWSFIHSKKAGKFTDTLPASSLQVIPLHGKKINPGVVALKTDALLNPKQEIFLETFLTQIATALEKELLEELATKASLLEESGKLYNTLFNSISHELKIPVTAILGNIEILVDNSTLKTPEIKLIKEINESANRLNHLIANLLDMSRLDSGRIAPKPDWIDLNDLAFQIENKMRDDLAPFHYERVITPNTPIIKADFGLLEQSVSNLLLNATQIAPHGSTLRLKIFYDNNHLSLIVMDRGPGFTTTDLSHAFEKFYRGSAKTNGTGLGLSLVKGFTEAQKGTVHIENRKNGGAKITIRIPCEAIAPDNLFNNDDNTSSNINH